MSDSEIPVAAVAFLLTAGLTPAIIHLCFRRQILDPPGALKIHKRPVPRLGGIAVAVAISAALLLVLPEMSIRKKLLFAALTVICGTGVCDDIWHFSVLSRFAAQTVAASLLWLGGWQFPTGGLPILSLALTVFWIVLCVNAFNFWDGADGLAAGTVCIVALGFMVTTSSQASVFSFAIACAVAGSCAAFLIFNLCGQIHLGDGGSTSLGFLIAALSLSVWGESSRTSGVPLLLFALTAAALPLLDCGFAIARRLRKGQSPFTGDRAHAYDLLLARGWSSRRVALACVLCTTALTMIACVGSRLSTSRDSLLTAASMGTLALVLCKLGILESEYDIQQVSEKEVSSAQMQRRSIAPTSPR